MSGWTILEGDELREFLAELSVQDARSEVERLRDALLRVARFSHAKDFSHHGVVFEECDHESCELARRDLRIRCSRK